MLSPSLCRSVFSITLTIFAAGCLMSDAIAQSLLSPEVHSDGRVTLRLRAEKAMEVEVSLGEKKVPMTKRDKGIWEGTSEPLSPQIYDYTFKVDGTTMIDPSNRQVKKWLTLASMVEIPGTPPRLTEFTDVPHGVVQRLIYPSASVGILGRSLFTLRPDTNQRATPNIHLCSCCTATVTTKPHGPTLDVLI